MPAVLCINITLHNLKENKIIFYSYEWNVPVKIHVHVFTVLNSGQEN